MYFPTSYKMADKMAEIGLRARLKAPNTPFVLPKPKPTTSEPLPELSKEPLPVPELSKEPFTAMQILTGNPLDFGVHFVSCSLCHFVPKSKHRRATDCFCRDLCKSEYLNHSSFFEFARMYLGYMFFQELNPHINDDYTPGSGLAAKLKEFITLVSEGFCLSVEMPTDAEMGAIATAFCRRLCGPNKKM